MQDFDKGRFKNQFCCGKRFFALGGGGGLHKNIFQILAIIEFSSGEISRNTLSARKNVIGNINLGQTSHLILDKFDIGIDIPDC